MKKIYNFFNVVDRYHNKINETFCVFGNEHQIAQFQFMAMDKMAKEWGRTFNPIEEFMPYDWNSNTVYIGGEITYNEPVYFFKGQKWINLDEIL